MDIEVKKFFNSLKCPICQSQIDLMGYPSRPEKSDFFNFGCASDTRHYKIWFVHWDIQPFKIQNEQVNVYDNLVKYQININHLGNYCEIWIFQVNGEMSVIGSPRYIKYNNILFDFQKVDKELLIFKIKTILTFH